MAKVRGMSRSHGKIKGDCRHHARQGAHIDRKNHLGNGSGSALPSNLLQQGLGHGARRHEDSAGCCDVSPRSPNQPTTSTPYRFSIQGHHVMFFLVYRDTMRGGRSSLGARHARVCVTEDTDPSPVDRISWWKVVRAPSRLFGQKTNLLSHHQQGFGIVT